MFVNSFFLLSTTFMTLLIQKNNFSLWFLPLHLIFYSFYCKIVGNNKGNRLNLSLSTKDNKTIQHFFFCWKQEPQYPKCFESYIWKKLESCNTLSCNVNVFYQTCKKNRQSETLCGYWCSTNNFCNESMHFSSWALYSANTLYDFYPGL